MVLMVVLKVTLLPTWTDGLYSWAPVWRQGGGCCGDLGPLWSSSAVLMRCSQTGECWWAVWKSQSSIVSVKTFSWCLCAGYKTWVACLVLKTHNHHPATAGIASGTVEEYHPHLSSHHSGWGGMYFINIDQNSWSKQLIKTANSVVIWWFMNREREKCFI